MLELRRILVPLDGSELSERALPYAIALAKQFQSEVTLLRVVEAPFQAGATDSNVDHWAREALQHGYREAQSYLDTTEIELKKQGIHARTLVREESPAADILLAAKSENADLIVISSHGKGGSTQWTAGSVADKVMNHSPCPVFLVRRNNGAEMTR